MQEINQLMIKRAKEMLESGEVNRVIGWKKGDFYYDNSPATFTLDNIDELVYNSFCGANLSKYLVAESKKEGKVLIFLKPCDTYSFNQLLSEHRINKDNIYVIAIECQGKLDIDKVQKKVNDAIVSVDEEGFNIKVKTLMDEIELPKYEYYLTKCATCKSKEFATFDEKIVINDMAADPNARFEEVEKLEKMTTDERYEFWRNELSKCIRCNACRNVCPACTCTNCVFDTPKSGISGKAPVNTFEENLYHIIRAYHVVGRCTDCGECSRVCPQNIPLHLINRKFIKDINTNYGVFQAGAKVSGDNPIVNYTKGDKEAREIVEGNND